MVTPHSHSLALELEPDLAHAVDPEVVLVDPGDLSFQLLVTHGSSRWLPGHGRIVRRWGNLQRLADRLDPEALSVCGNERRHLGRRPSSSVAKKTDAAFRISLARRSSRTSRSNAAVRSASSVVVPRRSPRSTSAWRTQLRRDSAPMPSCWATRVTTPCRSPARSTASKYSRTARSRSSGGYRRLGPGVWFDMAPFS